MTTAQKVLVGYGVIVLVYGFVLGVPLSLARQKAPAAPRSLVTAHLSGLIQPSMMIAMAFALAASGFDNGWATAGAWLLVAGGAAEMAGGTTNWLQGTGDQFAENPLRIFKIWEGGLVFYGGMIMGAIAFVFYCRRHSLPLLPMLDVMAPATAIGLAFGRIGCYFNGCCWGKACDAGYALAVRFPAGSPPATAEAASPWVHPTQIYSSANAFLLALLLWAVWRSRPAPGTVIGLLFSLYGASRFVLEGIRGDHGVQPGGWTVSQTVSSGMILLGVSLIVAALTRGRQGPASPSSPAMAGA